MPYWAPTPRWCRSNSQVARQAVGNLTEGARARARCCSALTYDLARVGARVLPVFAGDGMLLQETQLLLRARVIQDLNTLRIIWVATLVKIPTGHDRDGVGLRLRHRMPTTTRSVAKISAQYSGCETRQVIIFPLGHAPSRGVGQLYLDATPNPSTNKICLYRCLNAHPTTC
jgi:hypothetical protein